MKLAVSAVGCKLNQYEVQAIAEALQPYGFQRVPFASSADVYVINACTVTGRADFSSRQLIRQALRNSPSAKVIVTGCYAELEQEQLRALGDIAFIADNKQKREIPKMIMDIMGIETSELFVSDLKISGLSGHSRAFVKIQDGCAEKCTYCIIWKARGKPYSRDAGAIIDEINNLYSNGYREVVLTGVHIGKYHKDIDLVDLLKKIIEDTDMPRIRLSSLKPNEIKDGLIDLISFQARICSHFHLPIQSGDDEILKIMGRKYTAKSTQRLVNRLLDVRPDSTFGADFIIGFPGEDQRKFDNTLDLVNSTPIHHLHVFSYSDRPGTIASGLSDKISPIEKNVRRQALRSLGNQKKQIHMNKFIGKKLDVIVEESNNAGKSTGMSGNYLHVEFENSEYPKKSLVEILIKSANNGILQGELSSIGTLKN